MLSLRQLTNNCDAGTYVCQLVATYADTEAADRVIVMLAGGQTADKQQQRRNLCSRCGRPAGLSRFCSARVADNREGCCGEASCEAATESEQQGHQAEAAWHDGQTLE